MYTLPLGVQSPTQTKGWKKTAHNTGAHTQHGVVSGAPEIAAAAAASG